MKRGVSVILCCYNSATRLPDTLHHLAAQELTPGLSCELIVVDNASTDATRELALSWWSEKGRKDIPLNVVHESKPGLTFARATGIAASNMDVLIFCDDDNWLEKHYISHAFAIMLADERIGAAGGTGTGISEVPLPAWFDAYKFMYACYAQGSTTGELTQPTASLYGAGMVVRKKIFLELEQRGFKQVLTDRVGLRLSSGGDTELCYAMRMMGYRLWFTDALRFTHYLPANRLTEEYLLRLNKSLAYCSRQLIVYQYVLTDRSVNEMTWVKDMYYQLLSFIKSIFRNAVSGRSPFEKRMDLFFSFYCLKSILHQFGEYKKRYRQIIGLSEQKVQQHSGT